MDLDKIKYWILHESEYASVFNSEGMEEEAAEVRERGEEEGAQMVLELKDLIDDAKEKLLATTTLDQVIEVIKYFYGGDTLSIKHNLSTAMDLEQNNPEKKDLLGLGSENKNRFKNESDQPPIPGVPQVSPHDIFQAPDLGDHILDLFEEYKKSGDPELLKIIKQYSKHIGVSNNQLERRLARREQAKKVAPFCKIPSRKAQSSDRCPYCKVSLEPYSGTDQLLGGKKENRLQCPECFREFYKTPRGLDEVLGSGAFQRQKKGQSGVVSLSSISPTYERQIEQEVSQWFVKRGNRNPATPQEIQQLAQQFGIVISDMKGLIEAVRTRSSETPSRSLTLAQSAAMNPPAQMAYSSGSVGSTAAVGTGTGAALGVGKIPPPKPISPPPLGQKYVLDVDQNIWVLVPINQITPT